MSDNGKLPNGLDKRIAADYELERLGALDATAHEIFSKLMEVFIANVRDRNVNMRASMAVARAVTAKMYLAMDWQEQKESERLSVAMMQRIDWIAATTESGIIK